MELGEGFEFRCGSSKLLRLLISETDIGTHMAKSLRNAYAMQVKHQGIFENYNTTFPAHLTREWKAHILKWNKDHSIKPDPYEDIEIRLLFLFSVIEVFLIFTI